MRSFLRGSAGFAWVFLFAFFAFFVSSGLGKTYAQYSTPTPTPTQAPTPTPAPGCSIETGSPSGSGWKWLGNGNGTYAGSTAWCTIGTVPAAATDVAFAGWEGESDATITGDRGNYNVSLSTPTCSITASPPWGGSLEAGCYVMSSLSSDWRLSTNTSSGLDPECDVRYIASTRRVEMTDASSSGDCAFAIFVNLAPPTSTPTPTRTTTPTPTSIPTPTPTPVSNATCPVTAAAFWKMDETAGSNLADATENGNDATANGASPTAAGKLNYARSFNGSSDWVNVGANRTIAQNVSALTMSVWINLTSVTSVSEIVAFSINNGGTPTSNSRAYITFGTPSLGQMTCGGRSADGESLQRVTTTNSGISTGSWYNVTCVINYSADTVDIYINGNHMTTTGSISFSASTTPNSPSASSAIGSQDNGSANYFPGRIDEVGVWQRILNASEIWSLYNAGQACTYGSTTSIISGNVFDDVNANGARDTGENGMSGVAVTIPGIGPQTTDSSGDYIFTDIPAGNYNVDVTPPSGYTSTMTDPAPATVPPNATVNFGLTDNLECQDNADNNGNGIIDACELGCDINGVVSPSCPLPTPGPGTPTPTPGPNDYDPFDPSEDPACSDGINNDGSQGVDSQDPDCHTDGNTGNPGSYVPGFPSESPIPPLCEALTAASSTVGAGESTTITAQDCVSLTPPTYSWPPPTVVPQCQDGIDNDLDGLVDTNDPGCHTDGDAGNPGSYDPSDNSEGAIPGGSNPGSNNDGSGPTTTYTAPSNICSDQVVRQEVNATNPNGTSAISVDLTVTPRNILSGTVREDTAGNNCASGSTPYGASATVTVFDGGGTQTGSDSTDGTGAYSLADTTVCGDKTAVLSSVPEYHISAVRFDGGSWNTSGFSGLTYGPFDFSANHTLDFCISNVVSWFQTTTGDVRMNNLSNNVPGGKYASTDTNNPSVFYSSNFVSEFGSGNASTKGWVVNDEYTYEEDSRNRNGAMSYSFYMNRIAQQNVTTNNIPGCAGGNCTTGISNLATGAYHLNNGDLTLTSYSHQAGARVLLLVNGDVVIQSNVSVPSGSLLIIAAKGNITVDKSIGSTDPSVTTTHLNGILTAEGDIIADGDGCPSGAADRRLNISGALIANSVKPFQSGGAGSVVNNRSLCLEDRNYPSLYVSSRYDFITQLTDFYKTSYTRWREIAP